MSPGIDFYILFLVDGSWVVEWICMGGNETENLIVVGVGFIRAFFAWFYKGYFTKILQYTALGVLKLKYRCKFLVGLYK